MRCLLFFTLSLLFPHLTLPLPLSSYLLGSLSAPTLRGVLVWLTATWREADETYLSESEFGDQLQQPTVTTAGREVMSCTA